MHEQIDARRLDADAGPTSTVVVRGTEAFVPSP
jgi:hypothetical protein